MVKTRVMTSDDWDGIAEVWKEHEGINPVDDSPEGLAKYQAESQYQLCCR